MAERTMDWTGKSGKKYQYEVCKLGGQPEHAGDQLEPVPGNYIFVREDAPGAFTPVYVGETGNLNERFDNHHKIDCIRANRPTHILTHTNSTDKDIRRAEETDLKVALNPPATISAGCVKRGDYYAIPSIPVHRASRVADRLGLLGGAHLGDCTRRKGSRTQSVAMGSRGCLFPNPSADSRSLAATSAERVLPLSEGIAP